MNKFFSNLVLISSALIMTASVALYLSYQVGDLSFKKIPEEKARKVYSDKSGNSKYSFGACQEDEDCVPAGCSSHICSNDASIITTCEYSEDFPNTETFSCGCVDNTCAWYRE